MSNYYDEIIEEIEILLDDKKYDEAKVILKKELSMPYIPMDIEPKLKQLYRDCQFGTSKKNTSHTKDTSELLEMLHGTSEQQLLAVNGLCKYNLRDYVEDIQEYLIHNPFPEAAALLVECIGEQGIQEEFVWVKDGVEYTFYGDSITPCDQSLGYRKAKSYLETWLNKNLDMLEMAHMILVHEVFMFLPLSYDEEDALSLAYDVLEDICQMMNREDLLENVQKQIGFHSSHIPS